MVRAIEATAPDLPPGGWRVWTRPHRREPWRVVATAATKPAAAKLMFDLMTGQGGDWLVTSPDADSPNVRPAHLHR